MHPGLTAALKKRLAMPDLKKASTEARCRALDLHPPTYYKVLKGEGDLQFDTAAKLIAACGGDVARAFPDYSPPDARVASILKKFEKLRDPAKRPQVKNSGRGSYVFQSEPPGAHVIHDPPGRGHTPPIPVRVTDDYAREYAEIHAILLDVQALFDDVKRRTLSPEGNAPRSATYDPDTGRVQLLPTAPTDHHARSITNASGLEQLIASAHPDLWRATKGPLIIASHELSGTRHPQTTHLVLREPTDPRPRPGQTILITDPDDPGSTLLRTIEEARAGLYARGYADHQPGFPIDPARTTALARLLLTIP